MGDLGSDMLPIQSKSVFSNVDPTREGLSNSRWIIYELIREKRDEDPNTMWGLHKKTITSTPL